MTLDSKSHYKYSDTSPNKSSVLWLKRPLTRRLEIVTLIVEPKCSGSPVPDDVNLVPVAVVKSSVWCPEPECAASKVKVEIEESLKQLQRKEVTLCGIIVSWFSGIPIKVPEAAFIECLSYSIFTGVRSRSLFAYFHTFYVYFKQKKVDFRGIQTQIVA